MVVNQKQKAKPILLNSQLLMGHSTASSWCLMTLKDSSQNSGQQLNLLTYSKQCYEDREQYRRRDERFPGLLQLCHLPVILRSTTSRNWVHLDVGGSSSPHEWLVIPLPSGSPTTLLPGAEGNSNSYSPLVTGWFLWKPLTTWIHSEATETHYLEQTLP